MLQLHCNMLRVTVTGYSVTVTCNCVTVTCYSSLNSIEKQHILRSKSTLIFLQFPGWRANSFLYDSSVDLI